MTLVQILPSGIAPAARLLSSKSNAKRSAHLALWLALICPGIWPGPASAVQPVAPYVKGWTYRPARCDAPQPWFATQDDAVQYGVQHYYGQCGDATIVDSGQWGYPGHPNSGACGSSNYYPTYFMHIENENTRGYLVQYCGTNQDGLTLFRSRPVGCPVGYYGYSDWGNCVYQGDAIIALKTLGRSCRANTGDPLNVGEPINIATGNIFVQEQDFEGTAQGLLRLTRYYNSSASVRSEHFGEHWRDTYDREITLVDNTYIQTVTAWRPDGKAYFFSLVNGVWTPDPDVHDTLTQLSTNGQITGWRYVTADNTTEDYDAGGRLLSITNPQGLTETLSYDAGGFLQSVQDPFGRNLAFAYNTSPGHQISSVTLPDGQQITYTYSDTAQGSAIGTDLVAASYPAQGSQVERQYLYEDSAHPARLTGIVDENGNRYASWAYDNGGRGISSEHAGGADATMVTYGAAYSGQATVTDAAGEQRTYSTTVKQGVPYATNITGGPCSRCGALYTSASYDDNGNLTSRTDFNGNTTTYTYNDRGLEISRTEAAGTAQARTINTAWDPNFRLPALITEAGRTTAYTYDAAGRVLTRTITDTVSGQARIWTYTYNAQGLLASVDGPRTDVSDVTGYAYDSAGNLASVTNALNQVTQITAHDADGRPLTIKDPNGLVTQLVYDPRGRLLSRTADGETITYGYDDAGNLTSATLPDDSALSYTYDAANRLTDITDSLGNTIHYTLDASGNRIEEQIKDPQGNLTREHSRVYDALNRLVQDIGGMGQTTAYGYDPQGNRTSVTDPLGHVTASGFDALNRLTRLTDPANGVTDYGYDALAHVTSVTDPSGLTTSYTVDAFGDVLTRTSPDTGVTSYTYDAAGNRLSKTDARGVTVSYTYDALNRLTAAHYPDSSIDVTYAYDDTTNGPGGIGRLSSVTRGSGSSAVTRSYGYDLRGNRIYQGDGLPGAFETRYAYDAADRLAQIIYADGRTVDYTRDAAGRIAQVSTTLNGITTILAANATHAPFGPLSGYTALGGIPITRSYDTDYRLSTLVDGSPTTYLDLSYQYDADSNIIGITDNLQGVRTQGFGYDALNRLTSASGPYGSLQYSYDAIGDRLSLSSGSGTDTYDYAAGTHHLSDITGTNPRSFTYDAAGNTTRDDTLSFTYADNGRLQQVLDNGSAAGAYAYNGLGERVVKTAGTATTGYIYGPQGQLLAEVDPASEKVLREYVYLDGLPIARIDNPAHTAGVYSFSGTGSPSGQSAQIVFDSNAQTLSLSQGGAGANVYPLTLQGGSAAGLTWYTFSYTDTATGIYLYGGVTLDNSTASLYLLVATLQGWVPTLEYYTLSAPADASGPSTPVLYAIHPDHLGTPQLLTDASGTVVWSATYRPFGQASISTKQTVNNLRFPGQYFDAESRLHYNYFRDYAPGTGRYLEFDPLGLFQKPQLNTATMAPGIHSMEPPSFTLYVYGNANPLSHTDLSGQKSFSLFAEATFFYENLGGSYAFGFGGDTGGQLCFQITSCALVGVGVAGGIVCGATLDSANYREGDSLSGGAFGEVGSGGIATASISTAGNNLEGSATFGAGGGFAAGSQACITRTFCVSSTLH